MKHSIRFNIFVLIILGFISCKETRNIDVVGIIEDAITGEPVADADVRLFTNCGGYAIISFCKNAAASAKSNTSGQFAASILTDCGPGIEMDSEYMGLDAYVFMNEYSEMRLDRYACDDSNTAVLGNEDQIHLKILRYPGLSIRYDITRDSTMTIKLIKVAAKQLLVNEVEINGVYPVIDTATTIVFNMTYNDESTDKLTFDYHYLNNNRLNIKKYK